MRSKKFADKGKSISSKIHIYGEPLFRSDFAAWQAGKRAALTNDDQQMLGRFQLAQPNIQSDHEAFYK